MNASCRDLGLMDYKDCWELQQSLFDTLIARKTGRNGTGTLAAEAAGGISGTETGSAETAPGAEAGSGAGLAAGSPEAIPGTGAGRAHDGGVSPNDAGTVLLVEHPPVYTLGKSGHAENLLIGRKALEAMGAQFFHIDRGGDITFHGPGQLVCYPILDLERLGIGLRGYIDALEEAVIRTVAEYGIAAGRIAGASGVWIGGEAGNGTATDRSSRSGAGDCGADNNCGGNKTRSRGEDGTNDRNTAGKRGQGGGHATRDMRREEAQACGQDGVRSVSGGVPRKICAIGVRSSRYITMHGFALNVATDLGWFSRINPCGFTDRGVTSIERETGRKVAMDEVKALVVKFLSEILNVRIYK